MNPSDFFTFQNPNSIPNVTCNFAPVGLTFQNPTIPPPPPSPLPLNLNQAIETLKSSISNAKDALKRVSGFLNLDQTLIRHELSTCPFNSNHRMPSQRLFRHSLTCNSSPGALGVDNLGNLKYPNSLKSEKELKSEVQLFHEIHGVESDLCFSLDDGGGFSANFFYRDCPGVVSSSEPETKKTFTLPSILSRECVNLAGNCDFKPHGEFPWLLPSELWYMRKESGGWNDYPLCYSYASLKVSSCLSMVSKPEMVKWVLKNSPFYGSVIDNPMGEHIFLLLKLCFKAISREASSSLELHQNRDERDKGFDIKTLSFKCPVLAESLSWLGSHLSVLYGHNNGKVFAIHVLKESLFIMGSRLVLFPLGNPSINSNKELETKGSKKETDVVGVSGSDLDLKDGYLVEKQGSELQEIIGKKNDANSGMNSDEDLIGQRVFVSQIAAAIAALHERSFLEEKIKALSLSGPLSKSQLISEHDQVSRMANEERQNRPDYRAVLEHDGLLWQRSRHPDMNKNKTREELLAEERDYKRRRMSYRGKKVKRTPIQVLHDIIEGHMEEIECAGGIGCFVKGSEKPTSLSSGSIANNVISEDHHESQSHTYSSGETIRPHNQRKLFIGSSNVSSTRSNGVSIKDQSGMSSGLGSRSNYPRDGDQWHGDEHYTKHESQEDRKRRAYREEEKYSSYRSRSPSLHTTEQHWKSGKEDRWGDERERYDRADSRTSDRDKYQNGRSSSYASRSRKLSDGSAHRSEREDRHGRTYHISFSENNFDDRYDPSGSHGMYDEACNNASSSSKYERGDRWSNN
ncbi:hypothetical protein AMTRI_Chr09g13450 [Amborella trichopoda]